MIRVSITLYELCITCTSLETRLGLITRGFALDRNRSFLSDRERTLRGFPSDHCGSCTSDQLVKTLYHSLTGVDFTANPGN